jgi:SMI1-KNR4 cell-wall
MKKPMLLIKAGQKKLEAKKLRTRFVVSHPQKIEEIRVIEKKWGLILPDDYKEFITQYGLLRVQLTDEVSNWMIKLSEINEHLEYSFETIKEECDDSTARRFIPFQHSNIFFGPVSPPEYFAFLYDKKLRTCEVNQLYFETKWDQYQDENYPNYAKTFTQHIEKFVDTIVKWAEMNEKQIPFIPDPPKTMELLPIPFFTQQNQIERLISKDSIGTIYLIESGLPIPKFRTKDRKNSSAFSACLKVAEDKWIFFSGRSMRDIVKSWQLWAKKRPLNGYGSNQTIIGAGMIMANSNFPDAVLKKGKVLGPI